MSTYYLTFGQKHYREPHPVLGLDPRLPDGYMSIEAAHQVEARLWLFEHLGNVYAFLYDEQPLKMFAPRGCLGDVKAAVAEATRTCRVCGCTGARACDGGCTWTAIDIDVCSQCDL